MPCILQLHKLPFSTAHFNFTTAQIVINCTLKYALVAGEIIFHLCKNNLLSSRQSGFIKLHSTETQLLRLLSDINGAIDRTELTLLTLFDVSAAFDTVDYDILLMQLHITLGVSGNFLDLIG